MSSHNFAFLTKASFLGVTENQSACDYAVAGIAYDDATTNRSGARFGPHAIRRASHMLCDGVHPLWNRSPVSVLPDVGDLALPNTSLSAMRETRRRFLFGLIYVGRLLDAKNESARLSICGPRPAPHSRESGNPC